MKCRIVGCCISRAVASGPVGPVSTFRAGGCGKRQSARATCAHGAGAVDPPR